MPGLEQLKQFDNDISPIGNEAAIRLKNGTTMPVVAMPDNVPPGNDSLDFEFGLPQAGGESTDESGAPMQPEAAIQTEAAPAASTVDDLDPDVAAFFAPPQPEPAVPAETAPPSDEMSENASADIGDDALSFAGDDAGLNSDMPEFDMDNLEELSLDGEAPAEPDFDVEDIFSDDVSAAVPEAGASTDIDTGEINAASFDDEAVPENELDEEIFSAAVSGTDEDTDSDTSDIDTSEMDTISFGDEAVPENELDEKIFSAAVAEADRDAVSDAGAADFDMPDLDTGDLFDTSELDSLLPGDESAGETATAEAGEEASAVQDIGSDSDDNMAEDTDVLPDSAESVSEADSDAIPDVGAADFDMPALDTGDLFDTSELDSLLPDDESAGETAAAEAGEEASAVQDIGGDSDDGMAEDTGALPDSAESVAEADAEAVPDAGAADFDMPDLEADGSAEDMPPADAEMSAVADTADMFDTQGDFSEAEQEFNLNADLSEEMNEGFSPAPEISTEDMAQAVQDFDLDGLSGTDSDVSEGADDMQDAAAQEDGTAYADNDDFEIPGFSDTVADADNGSNYGAQKKHGAEDDLNRTYLSDSEYKTFTKNLRTYPLNLRIAIEQMISKNEFTDAAVMEVLFKVIKKVPARHLASLLGKMLDTSISVPLNYERRTAEQYELYKKSLEYQLKNRVLPIGAAGLILGGILYLLVQAGIAFVYRPLKAESLYKAGYNLIAQDLYAQSETKFDEALTYKVKKKWFFKYARAYRDKRQYGRAARMYEQLVKRFNFDKQGAMEYARMEFEDLANYGRAAEITRRFVLDHHINDKDAMLLLGDIYLDWADSLSDAVEKAEKFEEARLQYSTLIGLYGGPIYLSRMLRYFIRTDNLREVLPLKTYFTSSKKVTLPAEDLIELGGYLFEKQFGYLPPSDEYLRGYIDNVKKILEQGIKTDPTIPEGHYNLSRYFVRTGNTEQAVAALTNALAVFDAAKKKTHARTLKHIDTYRLLGEQYAAKQEYLLAEQQYAEGIRLFEQKKEQTNLKSDRNVGILYSDMADIDYFISGDIQTAFRNYKLAIEHGHNTPSIRYRIGFVQYTDANYSEALGSFIKTAAEDSSDRNLLLALGNVLSMRGDESAARGYYERLIHILDSDKRRYGIMFPQVREDHYKLVDLYLKASNNLGVTLSRLAVQTGDTSLQSQAIAHFSESARAWDALTRNQTTMVRLEGSNLAVQNIKYITFPQRMFEPSIYASIPSTLYGETGLKQYTLE